ncbi:hypothetical protein PV10_02489 [Exophiala mesophila]|uniref:Uncharacterized protein n=1 Tax=Exophiala mesophila TaxID=212818 RepID=A0A0D1ZJE9_EXOME|nr:uncharacterized protein PV10_02489 [Exophiala mesophila]KIV94757.1 hypothetical protein PV10_02489 [Exophiala mesophila]
MEDYLLENREDSGPRISKAKIESLQTEPAGPQISIFHKADRDSSVQFIQSIRRDTAMIFCNRVRTELLDNNSKSFTVIGCDLEALKQVLAWVEQCAIAGRCERFLDLDPKTPKLLSKYAWVVHAASYLGIPDRDFGDHIIERMLNVHAKTTLMSWEEVDIFLYSSKLDICKQQIREVAAASIFWAWWSAKLTDEDTPEDMDYLCDLRERDAKLDQALKDLCASNEQDIRKKWAEKDAMKEQKEVESLQQQEGAQAGQKAGTTNVWEEWTPVATSTATEGNGNAQVSGSDWQQFGIALETSAGNGWNGIKHVADATWPSAPVSDFDPANRNNDQDPSATFPVTGQFSTATAGNFSEQVNEQTLRGAECW